MQKNLFFIAAFLMCCLCACQKDDQKPAAGTLNRAMLIGKWTLNQQKVTEYTDNVLQTDTQYTAAETRIGYVQFKDNNTYVSHSYVSGKTGDITFVSADSVQGTFTVTGTKFSLSRNLTGFNSSFGVAGSGSLPVVSLVSKLEDVTQLTARQLTIHTETVFTQTIADNTKTYKSIQDFHYSK